MGGTDPVQSQGRVLDGWLIIEESILTTITETLMRDLILKILKVLNPDFDFSEVEKADDDVRFVEWFDEQDFLGDIARAVSASRDMGRLSEGANAILYVLNTHAPHLLPAKGLDEEAVNYAIEAALDDRFYQMDIDSYWKDTVDEKITEALEEVEFEVVQLTVKR